ncbi:MAG: LacI family transcriptional regulator [Planctomycetaceae bacterium]|nr:LacI family transcriptional regulator [Planctomycetaceae bacterium]
MVTVKDVAKAAGVSTATVSRVARNEDTVKQATRDLVLRVIKEMNYQPNALARQMRTQSTRSVVVIVPDIGNTFFHEILVGIQTTAEENGYQTLIANMDNKQDIENRYFNALLQRQIDGVISLSANAAKSLMERIAKRYPIVVACQYLDNKRIPNITIDNLSAAKCITEYLIGLGHRRIAHLTSDPEKLLYRDRLRGYTQALADHGIEVDEAIIRSGAPSFEGGFKQMNELLRLAEPVTAVFAAGDTMAIGAMKALQKAGKRIPEDVSVAGFDDIEFSSVFEPALTTIRQPRYWMGKSAMLKLIKLMNGHSLDQMQDLLDYELIVRDSCGARKLTE